VTLMPSIRRRRATSKETALPTRPFDIRDALETQQRTTSYPRWLRPANAATTSYRTPIATPHASGCAGTWASIN
jgi:hypothetical protein